MYKIVIDKREKEERKEVITNFFSKMKDCVVTEDTIEVGDYLVYQDSNLLFAIEWKTYSDFISSIQNGHLASQLDDMDQYPMGYLFITGNYVDWVKKSKKLHIHISREQISGFLTSIAGRHNTRCVMYESEQEGVNGILKLISICNGKGLDVKLPERHKTTGNPNIDMFMALPGVGPKKAVSYSISMSFYEFLTKCKQDNCKEIFKCMGVSVSQPIIDYCKKL